MGIYLIDWIKAKLFIDREISEVDFTDAFNEKLKALESLLGYKIKKHNYFIKALTHRSYLEISPQSKKSNERLEFLGDSVLGLIVAEYLFEKYPDNDEGFLTKSRAHIVNKDALAESANLIELNEFLLFDKRYLRGSIKGIRSINADALEALIGAIYIDGGLSRATEFIREWIIDPHMKKGTLKRDKNFKGQLLEYTHAKKMDNPIYRVVKEDGPEHDKLFTIEVFIGAKPYGTGEGQNKKSTEQEAAKKALIKLKAEEKKS
ncbi:MAG: ribonuclease III [Melioribacteraceae bacterium]|nr:ribonuclease III [Melioribacteraceae bacterium]